MSYENYRIYVVEGAEQLALLAAFKQTVIDAGKRRRAWEKRHGGYGVMVGHYPVAMLIKDSNPIPDGWKVCKYQRDVSAGSVAIAPITRTKAGRDLAKELHSLTIPEADAAAEAIGAGAFGLKATSAGMVVIRSQCWELNGRWILIHPKCVKHSGKFAGCRPIKLSELYAMKEQAA